MKHQKILLQIIEEEIEKACFAIGQGIFFEQVAPPAAPAAAPPTDPTAGAGSPPADPNAPADAADAGGGSEEGEKEEAKDEGDDVSKTIETLAKKATMDIKKTLLSDIQSGKREDVEKIVATVEAEKDSQDKDIQQAIDNIKKVFKFKVPEKVEKEAKEKAKEKEKEDKEEETEATPPATPPTGGAPPAAPVTESKLQFALREYLFYKNLYEKEAAK